MSSLKTCSICGETKNLMEFVLRTRSKDGRAGFCKPCKNAASRRLRVKDPEGHRRRDAKYNIVAMPYRAHKKNFCEHCSFVAIDSCQLHVDHIDGNHNNNNIDNLQTLCANCHSLKSKRNGDVGRPRRVG